MNLEKVKIKRIIGPTPSGAAVLLGNEKKTFVVFVGFYEAAAILREINHEIPARPLTHELIQNVFLGFGVEVKHVIISAILENTFCATLILQQKIERGGEEWAAKRNEVRIDARPSDCFVIALKNKVDIYVTQEVFEQVQDVSKMTEEVESSLGGGQPGSPGVPAPEEFDLDLSLSGEGQGEGTSGSILDDMGAGGSLDPDAESGSESDESPEEGSEESSEEEDDGDSDDFDLSDEEEDEDEEDEDEDDADQDDEDEDAGPGPEGGAGPDPKRKRGGGPHR